MVNISESGYIISVFHVNERKEGYVQQTSIAEIT